MARGEQVYAIREIMGLPYEHHGIDCGDGTVIHYRKVGEAEVARTSLESFALGSPVYIKSQPVSFMPDGVIRRAESRLGERQYDLFFNNCEHFATWCTTGQNRSPQLANFGLRLDQLKLPEVSRLAQKAVQDEPPAAALKLFREALENIAIATRTLLPQYNQACTDANTWRRVAQRALQKNREDLARAALFRKVKAEKKADLLKDQLGQLSDIQLTLEQNQVRSQEGI